MKKKIDATKWYEAIFYVASNYPENKEEKIRNLIFDLREKMKNEINLLWDVDRLNYDCDVSVWNDELNKEYKEYFTFKNKFIKNAIVEKEDYSLTRYELAKKYGKDWEKEKVFLNFLGFKKDLQIDQLESLASLMKKGYYDFWSYEIDKEASIHPKYHQYSISEYSKYIDDKNMFEDFEVEINQQKSKHIMKM